MGEISPSRLSTGCYKFIIMQQLQREILFKKKKKKKKRNGMFGIDLRGAPKLGEKCDKTLLAFCLFVFFYFYFFIIIFYFVARWMKKKQKGGEKIQNL